MERFEIDPLVVRQLLVHLALQLLLSLLCVGGKVLDPQVAAEDQRVEGILGWGLPLGCHGGEAEQVTLVDPGDEGGRLGLDDHLVLRQRPRLVGAQHVHPRHVLDGREAADNSTELGRRHPWKWGEDQWGTEMRGNGMLVENRRRPSRCNQKSNGQHMKWGFLKRNLVGHLACSNGKGCQTNDLDSHHILPCLPHNEVARTTAPMLEIPHHLLLK